MAGETNHALSQSLQESTDEPGDEGEGSSGRKIDALFLMNRFVSLFCGQNLPFPHLSLPFFPL